MEAAGEQAWLRCADQASTSTQTTFADLDDACLIRVLRNLEPLPHLFNVALACHRFRRLSTGDKRLWRMVAHVGFSPDRTPCGRAVGGPCYGSLAAAVADSRPGDTIWLSPGEPHPAEGIVLPHPLRLLGGGSRAEDVVVAAPRGADAALVLCATAKVSNLCIRASQGACVHHRRGCLRIERCLLHAQAQRGLEHLVAPLVTTAVSLKVEPGVPGGVPLGCGASPGAGRLSVVECRMLGASAAVQCAGTGSLQGVRVIYESHAAFFWLHVDSRQPGRFADPRSAAAFAAAWRRRPCAAAAAAQPPGPAAASVALKQEEGRQGGASSPGQWWLHGAEAEAGAGPRAPVLPHPDWPDSKQALPLPPPTPECGLRRIQEVLGKRQINPAVVAAHLEQRRLRQQRQQQPDPPAG